MTGIEMWDGGMVKLYFTITSLETDPATPFHGLELGQYNLLSPSRVNCFSLYQ